MSPTLQKSSIINPIYRSPASAGTFLGEFFLKRNASGLFEKPNHNRWLAERLETDKIRALSCLLGAFQQDIENARSVKNFRKYHNQADPKDPKEKTRLSQYHSHLTLFNDPI